jgi:hypothetical protein
MEEPLILDFQGVDMATSSFMDELIVKLLLKDDPKNFMRLKLTNIKPILKHMASFALMEI